MSRAGGEKSRAMPLPAAIARFVRPGMHLHLASTPSRSNASVRELARAFRGARPGFTFSATGFHSMAHLLPLLRLGARYLACFFGDNCPVPRPNPLYTALSAEGAVFEHWSLLSYVAALRAGALGHPYAVVSSLAGSTLGEELASAGRYFQVRDPAGGDREVGLVAALRPDVTFLHAAAADERGRVLLSAPRCEGTWGALAAREGVVVTVERLVSSEEVRRFPEALVLSPSRVLAVCEEPFGAHPQPLFAVPSLGEPGYRDDLEHYALWRRLAAAPGEAERFIREVLEAPEGAAAYRRFVGEDRLRSLRAAPGERAALPAPPPQDVPKEATRGERTIVLAARRIARRVKEAGYRVVLAGVGQAFFAARLAKLWLQAEGVEVEVIVETGVLDVECGTTAHGFLLARDNLAQAGRLTDVEDALGALTCGADNRCLGVIGAAQVDAEGNVNSTRLGSGQLLVGSGGAHDIAACADEVVVLSACAPERLVSRVDYLTSPGRAVRTVATDRCLLVRDGAGHPWRVEELLVEGQDAGRAFAEVAGRCAFSLGPPGPGTPPARVSDEELALLRRLDPAGEHTRR